MQIIRQSPPLRPLPAAERDARDNWQRHAVDCGNWPHKTTQLRQFAAMRLLLADLRGDVDVVLWREA